MERAVRETKILIHNGRREDYSLFGTMPDDGTMIFTVTACNLVSARLVLHCDGLSSDVGEVYREFELERNGEEFSVMLTSEELKEISPKGLYYYRYRLTFDDGVDEYAGEGVRTLLRADEAGDRQLLMYSKTFTTPEFLKQGVIYHVFVDRFVSSGKCRVKDGGRLNTDWENGIPEYPEYPGARIDNCEFFGGDLYGVAEKLGYLESLGVTCIYLSPIFESPSNHKYDTADYSRVDAGFGGDEALIELIEKAKERGISVMLDGVFNHTGDDSIYFNRKGKYDGLGAYQSKESKYYEWYYFDEYPDKYASWWGVDILPKVNSDCKSYRDYILGENGIIEKYMKLGVMGFRLDVADELSEDFLISLRKMVRKMNGDGIVLGEVWEDASNKIAYSQRRHYFDGNELDSVMNYPVRNAVIGYVLNGDAKTLKDVTEGLYRRYPKCVSDCLMNFLGTHDTERILTVLGGETSFGKSNGELAKMRMTEEEKKCGIGRLKTAYTVLAFLYGVPSVFYGDEAGLEGYRDPFCRRPYPWGHECGELVDFYRETGKIRKNEKVLKEGFFEVDEACDGVFIYRRFDENGSITVAANTGKTERRLLLDESARILLKTGENVIIRDGEMILKPMSATVIKNSLVKNEK